MDAKKLLTKWRESAADKATWLVAEREIFKICAAELREAIAKESPSRPMLSARVTREELDWVRHAARLVNLSPQEYIKRAVNAQLRHDGVDALLIRQSDWE